MNYLNNSSSGLNSNILLIIKINIFSGYLIINFWLKLK